MKIFNAELIRDIIERIEHTYPEKSGSKGDTDRFIKDAVSSLGGFKPCQESETLINGFLRHMQASEIACLAAWALYKDYSGMQGLRAVKNG